MSPTPALFNLPRLRCCHPNPKRMEGHRSFFFYFFFIFYFLFFFFKGIVLDH